MIFHSQYIVFSIAKPHFRGVFLLFLCNFIFKKVLTTDNKYAIIKIP